jgi:hypothetical protein
MRTYFYDYFLDERYNGCLFYQGYSQFGTTVAMVTNITIDFMLTLVTYIPRFTFI